MTEDQKEILRLREEITKITLCDDNKKILKLRGVITLIIFFGTVFVGFLFMEIGRLKKIENKCRSSATTDVIRSK